MVDELDQSGVQRGTRRKGKRVTLTDVEVILYESIQKRETRTRREVEVKRRESEKRGEKIRNGFTTRALTVPIKCVAQRQRKPSFVKRNR